MCAFMYELRKQPGSSQKHADWSMRRHRRLLQVYFRFGESPEYQFECGLGDLAVPRHVSFDGSEHETEHIIVESQTVIPWQRY